MVKIKRVKLFALFLAVILGISFTSGANILLTDEKGNVKTDFLLGEIVYVKGTGFESESLVNIDVTRPDYSFDSELEITDKDGNFNYKYKVESNNGRYYVYATDDKVSAQLIFTGSEITRECQSFGYDFGVAKWVCNGGVWEIDDEQIGGTSIEGDCRFANFSAGNSGADGVLVNAADIFYFRINSSSGMVEQQVPPITYITFCGYNQTTCSQNQQCGDQFTQTQCKDNKVLNITTTPSCVNGDCTNITSKDLIEECGLPSSKLVCVRRVLVNISENPRCARERCFNDRDIRIVEFCRGGCSDGQCIEGPFCGNEIIEGDEECDDGNDNNNDQCRNDCSLPSCGDNIMDENEQCDDGNEINGDGCSHKCTIEPTTCIHECFSPDSLGDTTPENPTRHSGEDNLEEFLADHGYTINVSQDQTNTQIWNISNKSVTLEITFIGGQAVEKHAFGYYLNSDSTTFVPIFEDDDNPLYDKPIASEGDSFTVTLNEGDYIGFAIDSWNGTSTSKMHLTENFLNFDGKDRAVVFDLCSEFVLAFENTYSDFDYQDLVVSIKLISCNSELVCGNEIIEGDEECDDGNTNNGDGCNAICELESCGDGIKQINEECDDGNQNNYDNCRNDCSLPACGDGIKDINEECDDGNINNEDSCNNKCIIIKECIDNDRDGVCDDQDDCPDSHPNEEVDENGCDIFQFCGLRICGFDCTSADWLGNEETNNPKDCKVIIPLSNGVPQQPKCVPTVFNSICAG